MLAVKAVLIFFLCIPCFCRANETIRLAVGEWVPYVIDDPKNPGIATTILKEAFAVKGIDVVIEFYPWPRAIELAKTGQVAGSFALAKTEERNKYFLYSDTMFAGEYVFFHLKSFPFEWKTLDDLKEVKLATTRGYGGMGDPFLKAEAQGKLLVDRVASDEQSFNMLRSSRVQAVPSELKVGYVWIKKLFGKDAELFIHHPRPLKENEYHLLISTKNKDAERLILLFNEGLKHLHKTGRYVQIFREAYETPLYQNSIPKRYLVLPKN